MPKTFVQALEARFGVDVSPLRRGLRRAVSEAKGAGQRISRVFATAARAAALVSAAVLGISAAAVKMASDFETSMTEVLTLIDATREESERLVGVVKGLSTQFGKAATEQAAGLYQAISAGATEAADATEVLTVANKAAVAGITSLDVSVEAIMRVINAYGLETEKAADVSDLLFQAVRKGVTTFGELAPKIGQVAGTAAAAQVSMVDLFAAIATATKRLPTDQVITGLNQLLLGFTKRTEDTNKAAEALEIQFDSSALAVRGLSGMMELIVGKLGMSVEELQKVTEAGGDAEESFKKIANRAGVSTEVITTLFPNMRALKVALALVADEGREFADQIDNMKNRVGVSEEAFQKMARTFQFQFARGVQEAKGALIDLGEALIPAATGVVDAVSGMMRRVRSVVSENQDRIARAAASVVETVGRGALRLADRLLAVVQFFRDNPMLAQGGLLGLVFLGPQGAAVIGSIGMVIDTLMDKFGGPQTVTAALNEKLRDQIDLQDELLRKARQAEQMGRGVVTGGFGEQERISVEEARRRAARLGESIEGIKRTVRGLGEEDFVDVFGDGGDVDRVLAESRAALQRWAREFEVSVSRIGAGAAGAVDEAASKTLSRVQSLTEASNALANEGFRRVEESWRGVNTEMGGTSEILDRALRESEETFAEWEAGERQIENVNNALASGVARVITEFDRLGDVILQVSQTILTQLVAAMAKAAFAGQSIAGVFASMSPLGIGLAGVGLLGSFLSFQTGGVVPSIPGRSRSRGVPAVVHPGEVVLNRSAVAAMGGAAQADMMNRGEPAGGAREVTVRIEVSDSNIPDPADYGIIGSRPQVKRLLAEALRGLKADGVKIGG